jgi:hypothetical protein
VVGMETMQGGCCWGEVKTAPGPGEGTTLPFSDSGVLFFFSSLVFSSFFFSSLLFVQAGREEVPQGPEASSDFGGDGAGDGAVYTGGKGRGQTEEGRAGVWAVVLS